MKLRIVLLLLLPVLAGCAPVPPPPSGDAGESTVPLSRPDALEALFRHQFENNASGGQQSVAAYCLRIGEDDPPAEFLARFADVRPPVRPASACEFRANRWVDRATGEPALRFYVESMSCTDRACEATGGYEEAGLSASGNRYRIERRDGRWTVTEDRMEWIS